MKNSSDSQQAPAIPLAAQNQSRVPPSWLPLHRCTVGGCDQSGAFDRRDGRCYFHGKIADGLFAGWRTLPAVRHRHEIRPGDSVMGRPEKYPYADWFDGEPHVLEQSADFDSNPAAMAALIRSAARTRHVTIHLQRHGPRISVQAMLGAA